MHQSLPLYQVAGIHSFFEKQYSAREYALFCLVFIAKLPSPRSIEVFWPFIIEFGILDDSFEKILIIRLQATTRDQMINTIIWEFTVELANGRIKEG